MDEKRQEDKQPLSLNQRHSRILTDFSVSRSKPTTKFPGIGADIPIAVCVCVFFPFGLIIIFFTPFVRFNYWAGIIPSKSSRILFICEFFLMD